MDALHHQLTVACDQRAGFDLFTVGMGTWWDPAYTPDAATFRGIDVPPHVGGVVAMQHGDTSYPFGEVLVWEPSTTYAQSFWLAMDAAHPSRLDVRFEQVDGVCTIRFDHGGWTEHNVDARAKYGDWPHLLGLFAAAAAGYG